MTSTQQLVAILPDQQVPYHDRYLHEAVCAWLANHKPERVVLSGDFLDFPSISRFRTHPDFSDSLQDTLDVGHAVLRDYRRALSRKTPISYLPGNHEQRLYDLLLRRGQRNEQELAGLHVAGKDSSNGEALLSLPHLLNLKLLGVSWVGDPRVTVAWPHAKLDLAPRLAVMHGWRAMKDSGRSGLATLDRLGYSVIVGHTHRQAIVFRTYHELGGNLRVLCAAEAGTLAQIRGGLGYAMLPDWQPGFATARIHEQGTFSLGLATWVNQKLLWEDSYRA